MLNIFLNKLSDKLSDRTKRISTFSICLLLFLVGFIGTTTWAFFVVSGNGFGLLQDGHRLNTIDPIFEPLCIFFLLVTIVLRAYHKYNFKLYALLILAFLLEFAIRIRFGPGATELNSQYYYIFILAIFLFIFSLITYKINPPDFE